MPGKCSRCLSAAVGTMVLYYQLPGCVWSDQWPKRTNQWKRDTTPICPPLTSNIQQLAVVFTDYAQVPDEGNGGVFDAVRHLLQLALKLMTTGNLDEEVDSEYVQGLDWYNSSIAVLAVRSSAG